MDIGKEIKKEAINQGIGLGELADRAEMKRPYFSIRVNGHRSFTADELVRVAEILDLPAWELMRRADECVAA